MPNLPVPPPPPLTATLTSATPSIRSTATTSLAASVRPVQCASGFAQDVSGMGWDLLWVWCRHRSKVCSLVHPLPYYALGFAVGRVYSSGKTPPGFNCRESINMQLGKKLNPSHPTVFVSVFLIEDVIQQPETWEEKKNTRGSSQVHLMINGCEEKPRGPG